VTPLQTIIAENNYKPVELADELDAMSELGKAFDKLDEDARDRIICWLQHRYDISETCPHCECECEDCAKCG
jgi:uncharacterized protein YdeI (YjbR/CyaY-like superfamily)